MAWGISAWGEQALKLNNTVTVSSTIQAAIDSIPAMQGSLAPGVTNPYVVLVPPGHETEYYSLVRDASGNLSDKRNVKVVFLDNPEGKFIVDQWDRCESLDNWGALGDTQLTLDSSEDLEGEYCFKLTRNGDPGIQKTGFVEDFRKYQGVLFSISFNPSEIQYFKILLYDTQSRFVEATLVYSLFTQNTIIRVDAYTNFGFNNTEFDFSKVGLFRIKGVRRSSFSGSVTFHVDNIRLVRTTPHKTIMLRWDDADDEHFTIAAKVLNEKGWRGNFSVITPHLWGAPDKLSAQQVQSMHAQGHDIINHSLNHKMISIISQQEIYSEFRCMDSCLEYYGLQESPSNVIVTPGGHSNSYFLDLLRSWGRRQRIPELNFFPVETIGFTNPDFSIPSSLQDFVNCPIGGIIDFIGHTITNESNFRDMLDWVEENFSEVIVASEILNRMPKEYKPVLSKPAATGYTTTLTDDFDLYPWHGKNIFLDPGGANRNIYPRGHNPYGCKTAFRPYHEVVIANTADAAETLLFDPSFTSSGSHDGSNGDTTLSDTTASWIPGQLVGRTVNNTTDGSSGVITANTETTVEAVLLNGTNNAWNTGDSYTITPAGLNYTISQGDTVSFVYDGKGWRSN